MRLLLRLIMSALAIVAFSIGTTWAQSANCPPEVVSAKAILMSRGGDLQASRDRDAGGPGNQGTQAGRSQDAQAPRNQNAQAPRSQDGSAIDSSDSRRAEALIKEAEAACKSGDTARASEKALAALDILKR
jgi:hypothetical protein